MNLRTLSNVVMIFTPLYSECPQNQILHIKVINPIRYKVYSLMRRTTVNFYIPALKIFHNVFALVCSVLP